jgi:hypothetical protein
MIVSQRDYQEECRDRERYVILLHLFTLTQAADEDIFPSERIVLDLGFSQDRADALIQGMVLAGYLRYAVGDSLALTRKGMDYIERQAGRRRTLRLVH